MRTLLQRLAALLALGLVGCAVTSNPDAYDVEGVQGAQLRAPQRIAVKNFYTAETVVRLARGFEVDTRQVTETAVSMPMTKAGLALDVAYGDGTSSTVLG